MAACMAGTDSLICDEQRKTRTLAETRSLVMPTKTANTFK